MTQCFWTAYLNCEELGCSNDIFAGCSGSSLSGDAQRIACHFYNTSNPADQGPDTEVTDAVTSATITHVVGIATPICYAQDNMDVCLDALLAPFGTLGVGTYVVDFAFDCALVMTAPTMDDGYGVTNGDLGPFLPGYSDVHPDYVLICTVQTNLGAIALRLSLSQCF